MNTASFKKAATFRRVVLPLLVSLICVRISLGQVATGFPPFASFSGGPDIVNNANGNVHITIPVFSRPGRGISFSYALQYDSSLWTPYGAGGFYGAWGMAGGWVVQSRAQVGRYDFSQVQECCPGQHCDPDLGTGTYYNRYSGWVYIDPNGTQHRVSVIVNDSSQLCPYGIGSWSATGGSDGWTMTVDATPEATFAYDIHGNSYDMQNSIVKDRNGNEVAGDYTLADTLSSTTPVLTISTSGNPVTYTYTAPSGQQASVKANYQSFTVRTNFGCSGVTEYGPTSQGLVTEIDLPDWNATTNPNSKYTFTYEATPGYSGDVTGRLASITLPTGGTITYSYSGPNNGITCADGSISTLTRTTPDGTWTYAHSESGSAWSTLITDPQANQTNMSFQGIYETERLIYQGSVSPSNLLLTVLTCYNGATPPCTNSVSSIGQKSVYTQWPSGRESETNVLYNNGLDLPTEQDDYDYGSGSPGGLLRKILISYASLGNYIADKPASVTVQNGSGTTVAQTNYTYDQGSVQPTSGTPQHVAVSGSRGNATTVQQLVQGTSTFLTSTIAYYDTGNVYTATDVNGAGTTYNYANATSTCGNAFPTSVSEPLSLTKSMTWNCTGGVMTQLTDENGNNSSVSYSDPYYWRPASATDQAGVATNFCYGLLSNSTGTCTLNPTQVESTLNFNSNNSTVDTLTTLDGLGRTHLKQTRQSPTSSNFDSVETDYDSLGRVRRVTLPYSGTSGHTNSTAPATTATYDALNRTLSVTDSGNGSASYTYTQNDTYISLGPAPTGENAKRRQLEYDGLGRLTSVCEITGATGNGNCAQTTPQTGYWTKYVYDPLGNATGVTQNAQSTGSQQTRSYSFDDLSRLTSETNPENGTTSYTFDSATGCTGTSSGDLVKRTDAQGNTTCFAYDALHRMTSATYSGPYAANTPAKNFVYDSATVNSQAMQNAKGRLAEAYTGPSTGRITDLGLSYTPRGEVRDIYQSTQHLSSYYYHLTENYWAHGVPSQLSGNIGLPTLSYGVDGEGRPTTISASSGQNPVTSTSYNLYSSPPQLQVAFGSGDSDTLSYDANTGRMTQYKFTVGNSPQSVVGNLTWNANGSLSQHAITDPFNSANTQTCAYQHDDLSRISQTDCGSGGWGQSFAYDPFGNITKNVLSGHTGNSFQPTYSSATNRMTALPGFTPTYDSNGNVLNDSSHQYAPDAEGRPVTLDTVSLTFDALNRMVEQHNGSSYTEIVYAPTGEKLALMSGQTLQKAFVPLPGGAAAVYTASGIDHYRHTDWLGSARLTSTPSRTVSGDTAYAPFGETYAQSGTPDISFTGQNQDTSGGLYDFLFREYSTQGRWPSPDPAGLAAVNPAVPQSWNRYAYVVNNPLLLVDPTGMVYGPCGPLDELCPPPPVSGPSGGVGGGGGAGGGIGGCVLYMPAEFEDPEHFLMDEDYLEPQGKGCGGAAGGGGGGGGAGNTSSPPAKCTNGVGSGGIGLGAGYNADLGVAVAGASSTGGVDVAAFHNKAGGVLSGYSAGAAASGGAAAYAGSKVAGVPSQTGSTVFVLGAYAGGGANVNFTNAASVQQTSGPFTTLSVNVGIGVANLGIQFSSGGGIWQVSITPPIVSVGWGAAASVITTNTVTTKTGCKP